ncbi:MAG: S41 family peptidase [Brevundimonas sp.]|uniref:S41 family peptidase n=1 Tax=Brevundimonas sp. TaxID=1871086 RepID=UPI00182CEB3B|nr:S41 family peptidase [Brevundimonas sp.]MBA4804693.1 S41 family peptidase [Brevundimonas sp.]
MIRRIPAVCAAVIALVLAPAAAGAQSADPQGVTMSPERNSAVVLSLAQVLRERFAFPERGAAAAREIEAMEARGEFRSAADAAALLALIEGKVAPLVNDRHFAVRYLGPDVTAGFREGPPPPEEVAAFHEEVRLRGGEVPEVRWLAGNVGYLRINMFLDAPPAAEKLAAAIGLLADTEALIIDVRGAPGGEPAGVANAIGHLVAERTPTVRAEERFAPAEARIYHAEPRTPAYVGKPVYVLIDGNTGSGAEEFAYDLQAMGRATLVGQTTYGAATPGGFRPLAEGFAAFIPMQVVTHTATGANWEGVGVRPDVETPAEQALARAHRLALDAILADAEGVRRALAEEGLAALEAPAG